MPDTPNPDPTLSLNTALIDTQSSIDLFDIQDSDYRAQLKFLIDLSIRSIANPNTRKAYSQHLRKFSHLRLPLSKIGVLEYLAQPKLSLSARRMALAALRRLTLNAEADRLISSITARDILLIKAPKYSSKMGRWLSIEGVRQLLSLPDSKTISGARDKALFGLLLGCGLRMAEATAITWDSYRQIDGRACLVDLLGKGAKYRTVPVPDWAAQALDIWSDHLTVGIGFREVALDGPILRSLKPLDLARRQHRLRQPLSNAGVAAIVRGYSDALGYQFTPHDLRRTLAQLMRKAQVPLEQCQFILGHESLKTTERYLGGAIVLDAGKAGVDQVAW